MSPRITGCLLALSLLLASLACSRKPSLVALPAAGAPGEMVSIQIDPPRRGAPAFRAATSDGTPVKIMRSDERHVEIILPRSVADSTKVEIFDADDLLGRVAVRSAPSRARRLLLSLNDDNVTLLRNYATSGTPTPQTRVRRSRLSFDVVNQGGVVVYSGSIPNPAMQRAERFSISGSEASARSVSVPGEVIFPLSIPARDDTLTVYLYEADAGLDLFDTDDRARRRLISRVEVRP